MDPRHSAGRPTPRDARTARLCRGLVLVATLLAPLAAAGPAEPGQSQPQLPQQQPLLREPKLRLTLDQAVARVRGENPQAEIVGASTRERASGPVHEVKLLTPNGKLRVVRFDASSGRRLD